MNKILHGVKCKTLLSMLTALNHQKHRRLLCMAVTLTSVEYDVGFYQQTLPMSCMWSSVVDDSSDESKQLRVNVSAGDDFLLTTTADVLPGIMIL